MAHTRKKKKVPKRTKKKRSYVSWISLTIALITLGVAGYALKLQLIDRIEKQPAVGVWLETIIFYGEYDNNLNPKIGFMVQIANVGGQPISLTPYMLIGEFVPKSLPLDFTFPSFQNAYVKNGAEIVLRMSGTLDLKFSEKERAAFDSNVREGKVEHLFDHIVLVLRTPDGREYFSQDFMEPKPIVARVINGPPVTVCLAGSAHPNVTVKEIEDDDINIVGWAIE